MSLSTSHTKVLVLSGYFVITDPCEGVSGVAYFNDPTDCRAYLICYPGMPPYKLTCSPDYSFDLGTSSCKFDKTCP